MFAQGDRITVRSTDSRRDGYVANDGTFLRYRNDHNGDAYAVEYEWCGMVATQFLDRCTITARNTPFRFH